MAHGIATRLVGLAGALLLAAAASPSWAQSKARPPEAMDGAWHFTIAPYFWASGISGTASVANLPEVPIDMPFSDIFSELDFGALGYFEARRDRFGIAADVVYVNLGVPVETSAPAIGSLSLKADVRSTIAEGFLFYRVATGGRSDNPATLDVIAGTRYSDSRTRLTATTGAGIAYDGEFQDLDWWDALAGVKFSAPLGSRVSVLGRAPTCAVPTSRTTRSSPHTCWSLRIRRCCSSARERSRRRCRLKLAGDGITVAPYREAAGALAALPSRSSLLLDPRRITLVFRQAVPETVKVIEAINPSTLAKSRKSEVEIAFVRQAMEQDGAALAEFFAWFEGALGRERITELTIDERVNAARARRPGFVCPSFSTIAGFNANGALPHYRATDEAHAVIGEPGRTGDGLLLIDSGGQYPFGTTDITRVVPVGATTREQREDFTRVLKGMIALSRAMFPRGTRSPTLDALARTPIWAGGIDYGHGTGHGVGYFLNVHGGPHGIRFNTPRLSTSIATVE